MQGSIELSVNVLTMGYWPPYTPMEVVLPPEVWNAHARSSVASYCMLLIYILCYAPTPLVEPCLTFVHVDVLQICVCCAAVKVVLISIAF